jgi:hypothetical protein
MTRRGGAKWGGPQATIIAKMEARLAPTTMS